MRKEGIDVVSVIQRAQRVARCQSRKSGDGADHLADDLLRAYTVVVQLLMAADGVVDGNGSDRIRLLEEGVAFARGEK